MTRTTGLKRPPQRLASAGPDPPTISKSGRSHTPVTGRKGPPAQYTPQIVTTDDDDEDDEEESEGDDDETEEEEEGDDGSSVTEDDSSEEEGFVGPAIDDSEEFSKRQLELIQLASDLSANDDLLSCIFVDTFGSMTAKDDLGVYYHQGDFLKPYFNRAEVVKMAQETIVQGNIQSALDRSLRLAVFRSRIGVLRSTNQIKKFVAHLKRYLMLYHPSSRVEIRTTDRYRFATQKSELAVHATCDLDPGITEYVQMDLRHACESFLPAAPEDGGKWPHLNGIPNQLNGQRMAAEYGSQGIDWQLETKPPMLVLDEITGAMEVMPKTWEQRLSGNNVEDDPDGRNAVTAAQRRLQARNVPYGDMDIDADAAEDEGPSGEAGPSARPMNGTKKMAEIRDFSVVNSGRQGLMLFLGPGRFINHDCSPNVELITTKRNVITFRVLRKIRTGEELTTWYGDNYFGPGNRDCLCLTCEHAHRGGFTRVNNANSNDATASGTTGKATEGSSSKRTSDAARRSAGQVTPSAVVSDGVLESGMAITVIDEGMESAEDSIAKGDDGESSSSKDEDMDDGLEKEKMHASVEADDADSRRRSARRSNSVPHRMTDSLSISTSARASPESSVAESSPARESARNKRRAAARGRERTSNMIQHPFGYSKVNGKNGMPSTSIANGYGSDGLGESTQPHSERDEPGTLRCTVCLSIMEPVWVSNRYVEQCRRCIRHKAIYGFKWPARAKVEEQPYPPVNMRPSWWVPPKISRHRFRSVTPSVMETNNSDDGQQLSDGEREANAQEEEARREVKRLHRREVLQAEAAAKFRKDLEAAQEQMERIEQSHAAEKEAAKTKPRQHNGGGNWGKYEYVWEEEEQSVVLQEGSKRSRRPTAQPESHPLAPKRRKTDESSIGSTRSHSRKAETNHFALPKRQQEKAHPAVQRRQRPKPKGPFFSAMPASPSADLLPVDDFDIMPLTTDQEPTANQAPITLMDDDSYDPDVEVIATNVARARAAQGGLEESYGSNVNPISLSAEEDQVNGRSNGNGNGNDSSDEDIFYSSHFSASALHYLMPSVTDGSVNTGGVPAGTTDERSKGVGSSRVQPSATKGISPLRHREVFRGTLSSPDVHPGVQPESYKQPKALTERGKGTRAALEAQKREEREGSRCGGNPPLLHSAEAEIARARQAAAFMESARRKPTRTTQVSRLSRQWHPSPSPTSFDEGRRDEDDSGVDEDENGLQEMLDTIVSSQLMNVDNVINTDSAEVSAQKPVEETDSPDAGELAVPSEPLSAKATDDEADCPPQEKDPAAVLSSQQEPLAARASTDMAEKDANVVPEALTQMETAARGEDLLLGMAVTHDACQPTTADVQNNASDDLLTEKEDVAEASTEKVEIAKESTENDDIAEVSTEKENVLEGTMTGLTSSVGQQASNAECEALVEEGAAQSPVQLSSTHGQPEDVEHSAIQQKVIFETEQRSLSEIDGQESVIRHSSVDISRVQEVASTPDNKDLTEADITRSAMGKEPVQYNTPAMELVLIGEPIASIDSQFTEEVITSTGEGSAYVNPAEPAAVDSLPDSPSTAQTHGATSAANLSDGPETVEQTPLAAKGSAEPVIDTPQPPSPLDSTIIPATISEQNANTIVPSGSETLLASLPLASPPTTPLCVTAQATKDDSAGFPQVGETMEMTTSMSTSEAIPEQKADTEEINPLSEEAPKQPFQNELDGISKGKKDTGQTTPSAENEPVKPSMDIDLTHGMEKGLTSTPAPAPGSGPAAQTDINMETDASIDPAVNEPSAPAVSMKPVAEEESIGTLEIDTNNNSNLDRAPALTTTTTPSTVVNENLDFATELDASTDLPDDHSLAIAAVPAESTEPVTQESLQVVRDLPPLDCDRGKVALSDEVATLANHDTIGTASQDQQTASTIEAHSPNQPDGNRIGMANQALQASSAATPSTAIQATGHTEPQISESAMNSPDPLLDSDLPVSDSLPLPEAEPPIDEIVERPAQMSSIPEIPRLQSQSLTSLSTPARPSSTISPSTATSKKRRRGGNAPIPIGTPIVVLSSDDEVEIIPPPKKVVLRAPTGSSVLPSPHPIRTPGSQGRHASTIINPISLGTPVSQRILVISSPAISRSPRASTNTSSSTSTAAHVSPPVVTPDSRKGSQKGALFLPSTRKALESRRTIEALRRIQLAAAGRPESSEDTSSEVIAADTSATGVDTSWQPETSGTTAASSAWDTPAALTPANGETLDSDVNTGWGGSNTAPTENSAGWDPSVQTTSASNAWNPQTSAGTDVDNGWNAQPATQFVGNDSWDTPTAITSSANNGWDTQPTISQNAVNTWTTSSTNIDGPSTNPASHGARPETSSTGWGAATNPASGTHAGSDVPARAEPMATNGWNHAPASNQAPSHGWSEAPTQETGKNIQNTGWGDTTQSSNANDGWGAPVLAPVQAWVTQQNADTAGSARPSPSFRNWAAPEANQLDKLPSSTDDPNAWEPEPKTAESAPDWSVWGTSADTSSGNVPSSGWDDPPARQTSNSWNAPSHNSAGREPGLSVATTADAGRAFAPAQNGWDIPASASNSRNESHPSVAPPTKPRRQTAEDFWQKSDLPNFNSAPTPYTPTSPAKKVDASAGWGSWEPSDSSSKPRDDGWGNVTASAAVSGWSAGGGWDSNPRGRSTEAASTSSRPGGRSRPTSRTRPPSGPASSRAADPWRETRRDDDVDDRRHRKHYDDAASEHRTRRSERGDSESRHASRRESDRRHSRERRGERSDRRHSEKREDAGHDRESSRRHSERRESDYDRRSERRERHRSRSPERGSTREHGRDHRDESEYDWRRAHLPEDRTDVKSVRRDDDERHSERREHRRRESRHEESEKRPTERPASGSMGSERRSDTRVQDKIHPSRLTAVSQHPDRQHDRRQSAGAGSEPEPGQLIDEPRYPEARTSTNAMPLGRKMRVFGKGPVENAPRGPRSTSIQPASTSIQPEPVQPEKSYADGGDGGEGQTTLELNASDSAVTTTTGDPGWAEGTAAASTDEQGSGWDAWGSTSVEKFPQVNAGW